MTRWICVCLVLVANMIGCSAPNDVSSVPSTGSNFQRVEINTRVGFESKTKLRGHFQKHGADFGASSEQEYLKLAQECRDKPVGANVLEAKRSDGVSTRFDKSTGAFLAYNPDRTIRTFFKPNDGERYYWRQLKR